MCSCSGDIGDRELVARLLAEHKPRAVLNFAAESHVDRSIEGPGEFIQTNIVGTFNLLEAVRAYWNACRRASARSASCTCRPTKSMARWRRRRSGLQRDPPLRAEQPVLGQQGRQRPPGARLPPHLRPAGADHQLLEQLRSVPLPGKADPAGDPQCAGRQAAADLRRRPAGARLAVRDRPLQRDPARARSRRWARPTTSAAGTKRPTSMSCVRCARSSMRTAPARRRPVVRQPDHLREGPSGHDRRYAIDARQAGARAGLEVRRNLRDRHPQDGAVVSGEPAVGRQCHQRRLPRVGGKAVRHEDSPAGQGRPGRLGAAARAGAAGRAARLGRADCDLAHARIAARAGRRTRPT
jgi:hypothetical protein